MDSDLSRQVAEAMGKRAVSHTADDYTVYTSDGEPIPHVFDLADARDRDAAIAWLVAKGWTVRLDHGPDGHAVIIWTDTDLVTKGAYPRPTIEEAFGRAFLGAVGAQG